MKTEMSPVFGKCHETRMPRHAGFTLVEMLVVISIIGVLLMFLMPAIQHAIETAYGTQCTNNLKNVLTAEFMYAMENRGYGAPAFSRFKTPKQTDLYWANYLSGGVERYKMGSYVDDNRIFHCPRAAYPEDNSNALAHTYGKFYYTVAKATKDMEFPDMPYSQWGKTVEKDGYANPYFMYSRMKYPGKFPLFADSVTIDGNQYQTHKFCPRRAEKNSSNNIVGLQVRHNHKSVVGFVDNHVAALNVEKLRAAQITHIITEDFLSLKYK